MTKPRGAPQRPTALRREGARIVVRVSRREYEILRAIAHTHGDTLAGCIREALYDWGMDVFTAPSSISGQPPR